MQAMNALKAKLKGAESKRLLDVTGKGSEARNKQNQKRVVEGKKSSSEYDVKKGGGERGGRSA